MGVLRVGEPGYPELLAAIYDPPPRLYLRGQRVEVLAGPCVAVVGARSCSPYGRQVARLLGRELASAGAVVVSGLARGVDGEAHRGALETGGATVAVLGCGIDRDYPAAHAELARRIACTGLVVSEYEPGVPPAPWQFPARNRIIAGLSQAVVVVEARERSGALITADFAVEEGREVLAVPGEITSALSAGTNGLLRVGAAPVLGVEDILVPLGLDPAEVRSVPNGPAALVHAAVLEGPGDIDLLASRAGLPVSQAAAALVDLELQHLVTIEDGVYRALGRAVRGVGH